MVGIEIYICTPLLADVLGLPYVGINPTGPLPYSMYTLWRGSGREHFLPLRVSYVPEMEAAFVHPMVRRPSCVSQCSLSRSCACMQRQPKPLTGLSQMHALGATLPQPARVLCCSVEHACMAEGKVACCQPCSRRMLLSG